MKKDTIIIPDIHGRIKTLQKVLAYFPKEEYDYIFLGDLVDRGPQSSRVVETVTDLILEGHARFCKGNHELMMLDAIINPQHFLETWVVNGGVATWESFANGKDAYSKLLMLLGYSEDYIILDDTLYSHAARPLIENSKVLGMYHVWNRPNQGQFKLPLGVKWSVHGHTPMANPTKDEGTKSIYIDLGLDSLCVMSHKTQQMTRFRNQDEIHEYSIDYIKQSYFAIQQHLLEVKL